MTRILFLGDSITDAYRDRTYNTPSDFGSYGQGFPIFASAGLYKSKPNAYEVYNRGISGDRIVDLYARIKKDVWNLQPDVLSILVGVNDVWHEVEFNNGVDIARFETTYRHLIEDTLKVLPNVKIILCEPFVLEGSATQNTEEKPDKFQRFCEVFDYAKVVKKLAEEYGLFFLPLQEMLGKKAEEYGVEPILFDGVHPMVTGASFIADEWLKLFFEKVEK